MATICDAAVLVESARRSKDMTIFQTNKIKVAFSTVALVAGAMFGTACSTGANTQTTGEEVMNQQEITNTEKAIALLESIETGAKEPIAYINPEKYIQHNLMAGDGLAGFGELLSHLPEGGAKVKVIRAFQDGDYVFTHTEYDFFGPKIGFDVFRFEDGLIVEHWDNLQVTPDAPNPSGHTMTDGPVQVEALDQTEANRVLVRGFVEDILVAGKMEKITEYIEPTTYTQHNPGIGDGLDALGAALEAMAKQGIVMRFDKVHKVLAQGNFVLVMSEGALGDAPTAFYDLFRVEDGKIVEHWDTIEAIPPREEWKNDNGKF